MKEEDKAEFTSSADVTFRAHADTWKHALREHLDRYARPKKRGIIKTRYFVSTIIKEINKDRVLTVEAHAA